MWKRDEVIPRVLAIFVGAVLVLFEATVPSRILGDDSQLLMALDVVVYGISGIFFGYVWPDGGWRLGLYLFAIWPPVLLFSAFLTGEVPWDRRATINLLGYLMILLAACFGAWLGALLRQRLGNQIVGSNQ